MKFFRPQVSGELLDHLTCWDALRVALPVGTVTGAPKVGDTLDFKFVDGNVV